MHFLNIDQVRRRFLSNTNQYGKHLHVSFYSLLSYTAKALEKRGLQCVETQEYLCNVILDLLMKAFQGMSGAEEKDVPVLTREDATFGMR